MVDLTANPIVFYVLKDGSRAGQSQLAVIVRVWSSTLVNLLVFMDGSNDGSRFGVSQLMWVTSAEYSRDQKLGTWHMLSDANTIL